MFARGPSSKCKFRLAVYKGFDHLLSKSPSQNNFPLVYLPLNESLLYMITTLHQAGGVEGEPVSARRAVETYTCMALQANPRRFICFEEHSRHPLRDHL